MKADKTRKSLRAVKARALCDPAVRAAYKGLSDEFEMAREQASSILAYRAALCEGRGLQSGAAAGAGLKGR